MKMQSHSFICGLGLMLSLTVALDAQETQTPAPAKPSNIMIAPKPVGEAGPLVAVAEVPKPADIAKPAGEAPAPAPVEGGGAPAPVPHPAGPASATGPAPIPAPNPVPVPPETGGEAKPVAPHAGPGAPVVTPSAIPKVEAPTLSHVSPAVAGFMPPKPPNVEEFLALAEKSPFTDPKPVETGPVEPPELPNFGLVGIMDTKGGLMAVLTNKDTGEFLQLREGGDAVNGLKCVQIEHPDQIAQTVVQIDVGGQVASVSYDQDQLIVKPGAGAPKMATRSQGQGHQGGAPGGGPGGVPTPNAAPGQPNPAQTGAVSGAPGGVTGASGGPPQGGFGNRGGWGGGGPGGGSRGGSSVQGGSPPSGSSPSSTTTPRRRIVLPR